jgi:hypothetical protein
MTSGDATAPADGFVEPGASAPPSATPEAEVASPLPDLSQYDLTVGEALAVFHEKNRRIPSIRSLQRYCQEGRFDCYKLKTTRNGNPVHEWIMNSTSLLRFVEAKTEDDSPPNPATPKAYGDASGSVGTRDNAQVSASATATSKDADDAKEDLALPRSSQDAPDVTATPDEDDDTNAGAMSQVEVMIENARLTAQLEAQNELWGELRDDKRFMREEMTQYRRNDRLLADMHRETLQTLKAVAVAGRHTKIELPGAAKPGERDDLFRDVTESEQAGPDHAAGGV